MKEFYIVPELKLISFLPAEELALQLAPVEGINERFDAPADEASDDLSFDFDS